MSQVYVGYGGNVPIGPYLHDTRQKCIEIIKPHNMTELVQNVTACMFAQFTEFDKALYSSHNYILTLWPAFVGAIVALAPDACLVVYDNIWWSSLFAVTSGGLPGLMGSSIPPHHVEAESYGEGHAICIGPHKYSKTETMDGQTRGTAYVRFEWFSWAFCCTIWVTFVVLFAVTLKDSLQLSFPIDRWLAPAAWYYISASPAIAGVIFEFLQNRVELYEPVSAGGSGAAARSLIQGGQPPAQRQFGRVRLNSIDCWLRIFRHQWRRSTYRIIVRTPSPHWFFVLGRAFVGIGRVTVFALGSVSMGGVLFMPIRQDLVLFILLLFATAVPRQIWPAFWGNGNRGADLVVFVKPIKFERSHRDTEDDQPSCTVTAVAKTS